MQQKKLPAPLLYPVLCWCLGIGLGKLLVIPFWWLFPAAVIQVCIGLFVKSLRLYSLLLLCVALGAMRFAASAEPTTLDRIFARQEHIQQQANFLVNQQLSRDAGIYEIKLEQLAGIRIREPILLFSDSSLTPGQSYSALLEILPGKKDPVLDTFPARHRAYIRQSLTQLPAKKKLFPIATWRVKLLANLDAKLGDEADFAKALLFSDTAGKGKYSSQLKRSGMIHLIVVSGLHIWFIYLMLMILLNALLPRRLGELIFLVLIGFYAALNHWSPPVMRSVLMIGLLIIARWRSIPMAGEQLLALSLLIITVVSPGQLFDIGLQLSFVCIGVIMLALPKIVWIKEKDLPSDRTRLFLNKTLDLLLLNLAVGIAISPLTLYYFGTASLNGIIGNLLGIPLTSALLALCFIVLLLPGGNFLSAAFISSYRLVLLVFERWTDWVASLPFYLQNAWLSHWQLIGSIIIVLALLYSLRRMKLQWRVVSVALLGLGLIVLPQLIFKSKGGIYVFNSGTADCILAHFGDGENLLIDTGPMTYNAKQSWASRKLLPWLKRRNMGKIDLLVLTHLDADHSGGFADVAAALKPERIVISDETLFDPRWQEWENAGLLKDSQVVCIRDTLSVFVGKARLKFLHPDASYFSDTSNGVSLLFRLDYLSRRYLFTGDADTDAEKHLLEKYPQELKADYLKAGHHGSRSSNSREFVRSVQPDEVWITAAKKNRWDFPHPEAMSAFRLYAKSIRSTADGTIYIPFAQKD